MYEFRNAESANNVPESTPNGPEFWGDRIGPVAFPAQFTTLKNGELFGTVRGKPGALKLKPVLKKKSGEQTSGEQSGLSGLKLTK